LPDFDLHQPLIDLETSSFEDKIRRFEVEQRLLERKIGRFRVEIR